MPVTIAVIETGTATRELCASLDSQMTLDRAQEQVVGCFVGLVFGFPDDFMVPKTSWLGALWVSSPRKEMGEGCNCFVQPELS